MKKNNKAVVLLKILLKGYPVIKDTKKYLLSDDYYLCQEAISENTITKEKKKILLKVQLGIGLKEFIDWASSFTDNEIYTNAGNATLNDIKRGE